MKEDKDDVSVLLRLKNAHQVQKYLSENSRLDLMTLKDGNKNTLLHNAATWDKIALVRMYLQHQRDLLLEANNKDAEFVKKKLE